MDLEEQLAEKLAYEIRNEIDQAIFIELTHNWPRIVEDGLPYGWAGDYQIVETPQKRYIDIVKWIKANINNSEKNAYWTKLRQRTHVLIRRPQDLTAFLLRWS